MVMITFSGALGVAFTAGMAWMLIPINQWQMFLFMCAVPSFLVFILRWVINLESPRYLLTSGRYDEALDILWTIAKENETEENMIGVGISCSKRDIRGSFTSLFSRKYALVTLQISALWLLQSTGYWGVTIFLPKYLSRFGVNPYINMFINVCAEVPGLFLVILMVDTRRFGRLRTWYMFSFGTVCSLIFLTFFQTDVEVSVFAVITYFFMVPIYSLLQTYTPEVYPTWLRSTAMVWINFMISIPGMMASFISAKLVSDSRRWLYPLIWAIVFAVQFLIVLTLRKETSQKALEEDNIEEMNESLMSHSKSYGSIE